MDEITLTGETHVTLVEDGVATEQTWNPSDFDLELADLSDLQVDNPQESAARIQAVLRGDPGPSRDIVVVNAATAIWVTHTDTSLAACARLAEAAIDDGRASALLTELGQLSHQPE